MDIQLYYAVRQFSIIKPGRRRYSETLSVTHIPYLTGVRCNQGVGVANLTAGAAQSGTEYRRAQRRPARKVEAFEKLERLAEFGNIGSFHLARPGFDLETQFMCRNSGNETASFEHCQFFENAFMPFCHVGDMHEHIAVKQISRTFQSTPFRPRRAITARRSSGDMRSRTGLVAGRATLACGVFLCRALGNAVFAVARGAFICDTSNDVA